MGQSVLGRALTLEFTIALAYAIAATGCVCTCVAHEADTSFEAACVEQGGHVQRHARGNESCVADAGVVATWVRDDEDAGD